jgi:hypothetical protein
MITVPVIIRNMIKISTSKITVLVIIRNMVQITVQIFEAVTLPVLKVVIHPAGGPGRAAIR